MTKNLSDMSNEELWKLFPIILTEHNPEWKNDYLQEKSLLEKILGEKQISRISHIGSTAVPGLIAKPTIDILLEITLGTAPETLKSQLEVGGYLFSPQPDKPAPHMMFMKGYTPNGFADKVYHIHIRYSGNWDELYFRDYLIEHPDIAKEYGMLKMNLLKQYRYNRDGYTEAKGDFIRKITTIAKEKYK